jgi:hypothetical protein
LHLKSRSSCPGIRSNLNAPGKEAFALEQNSNQKEGRPLLLSFVSIAFHPNARFQRQKSGLLAGKMPISRLLHVLIQNARDDSSASNCKRTYDARQGDVGSEAKNESR